MIARFAIALAALFGVSIAGPIHTSAQDGNRSEIASYASALERALPGVVLVGRLIATDRSSVPEFEAIGSGVIVDSDAGLVITSAHMVDGEGPFLVELRGGDQRAAAVVGRDPSTDIAVLRLDDATGLTALNASTRPARIGDVVFAVGYFLGLEQMVTGGIVSGLGRRTDNGVAQAFIQTDVAITPGSSGGPLLDSQGRLIGINTAIWTTTDANGGLGFAVPAGLALTVADQLVTYGEIRSGGVGAMIVTNGPGAATDGALVIRVSPGSPADRAGLREGDLVTSFEGAPLGSANDLAMALSASPRGSEVSLHVQRGPDVLRFVVEIEATVGQLPTGFRELGAELGLRPAKLPDLPGGVRGVAVTAISDGSPMAMAGIRSGDLMIAINRKSAAAPRQFDYLLKVTGGRALLLMYRRGTYLPISFAEI